MARGQRLFFPLLLASMLLAGCLKGDPDAVEAAAANESGPVADAPDGRGRIVAFEETNKTTEGADGLEHDHDYWQGATRMPLIETLVSLPLATDGETSRDVQPEQFTLVYEGTATVELTLSAPKRVIDGDPAGARPPMVYYRHAAASEWIQVGQPEWDAPLVVKVTDPIQTDMPHATWSLWAFRFASTDPMANLLAFDVFAEIVRGEGDIPVWPGHPDLYADTQQRRVLETDAHSAQNGFVGDVLPIEENDGAVSPEHVVSYGTRTLYVYLNITSFDVTNPLDKPTNFFLWFHNASGRWNTTDLFDTTNHSAEQMEHRFVIRVTDDGMDSPYASASRWAFELGAAFLQGADGVFQVSCYSGCATWSSDYRVTVIATTEELPDEAYDATA